MAGMPEPVLLPFPAIVVITCPRERDDARASAAAMERENVRIAISLHTRSWPRRQYRAGGEFGLGARDAACSLFYRYGFIGESESGARPRPTRSNIHTADGRRGPLQGGQRQQPACRATSGGATNCAATTTFPAWPMEPGPCWNGTRISAWRRSGRRSSLFR